MYVKRAVSHQLHALFNGQPRLGQDRLKRLRMDDTAVLGDRHPNRTDGMTEMNEAASLPQLLPARAPEDPKICTAVMRGSRSLIAFQGTLSAFLGGAGQRPPSVHRSHAATVRRSEARRGRQQSH